MLFWLALTAAFGCAVCNGLAAILEKSGADQQATVATMQITLLWRLLSDWAYILGILLDFLAFVLTLIAVHTLPLFVVQPIIASSVAVTALIERFILRHKLGWLTWIAILCIVIGLSLLTLTATPEQAHSVVAVVRWTIIFCPLLIAAAGALVTRSNRHSATIMLGALSGIAFGGTALVCRMLRFSQPYWHLVTNPLVWALLAYGLIAILLFTIALQRHQASVVNASMITFETVVPMAIGIAFLGDSPKSGAWGLVVAGVVLTLTGALIIAWPRATPSPIKTA
jgi:drug/metabolite transporter (DMT)-like permease